MIYFPPTCLRENLKEASSRWMELVGNVVPETECVWVLLLSFGLLPAS